MKLGLVSAICDTMNYEEMIDLVAEAGLECVEVACWPAGKAERRYCATLRPSGYGTVGGIRINENCECCDKDFEPVPGLYAVGADACNLYDDSYMFLLPGNSMGFAVNSGRIAGKEAAAYIRKA